MTKKTKPVGEVIYGINPIIELLKAKRRKVLTIYTTKPTPEAFKRIEPLLPAYPVTIQYVVRDQLHRISGTTDHQSVVALVQPYPFRKQFFDPAKQPFLVMLDRLQDPRNLGAIIRTAYCAGMSGIIICQHDSAPLNGAAIKASAGLSEHIEIYQASSPMAAAQLLQKAGYTIYLGTFGGTSLNATQFKTPLCIVIGSEGTGITKALLPMGQSVTLAQRRTDISYNASVAAAIFIYSIATQHKTV